VAATPSPPDAAERFAKARSAFARYRVMAVVTGVWLLLLCTELVLKYVVQLNGAGPDGSPRAVLGSWVAIAHGWIYVIYLVTVVDLWTRMRWSLSRVAGMVVAGVVPFLSFVVEHRAARWFARSVAEAEQGTGPTILAP
jgi:integral membrane protein